ncbi:hypothetical protein DBV15_04589 [Temnothorax longispinosus]|uniref:Uncharacterized protein n=1 Tax=Temnothorax longispinosus TaxID=300112 RepID=A0A4S2KWJ6_9HYME|nr:hypothetical protein DBV15_04589 [Temnothorax longispinosus]
MCGVLQTGQIAEFPRFNLMKLLQGHLTVPTIYRAKCFSREKGIPEIRKYCCIPALVCEFVCGRDEAPVNVRRWPIDIDKLERDSDASIARAKYPPLFSPAWRRRSFPEKLRSVYLPAKTEHFEDTWDTSNIDELANEEERHGNREQLHRSRLCEDPRDAVTREFLGEESGRRRYEEEMSLNHRYYVKLDERSNFGPLGQPRISYRLAWKTFLLVSPLAVRLLETNNSGNRFHSFKTRIVFREFCSEDIKAIIVSWQEYLALSNEQRFQTSKTLLGVLQLVTHGDIANMVKDSASTFLVDGERMPVSRIVEDTRVLKKKKLAFPMKKLLNCIMSALTHMSIEDDPCQSRYRNEPLTKTWDLIGLETNATAR